MGIHESSMISCFTDASALLVTVLLLLLSERFHNRKNVSLRIFYLLSLCLMATCVMSFVCHAMLRQTAPWCHVLAIACRTLWELLAMAIILLWIAYVETKLYGEKKQFSPAQKLVLLPFAVFAVLLIVNLFTGILFRYTADNQCETKWPYNLLLLTEVIYFLSPLIRVKDFDRNASKARFLRVLPMLLPVGLGVSVQFFLPFQTDALGFAIGAALLYFSMADELRYLDEESGLYNDNFLPYSFDRAVAGKNDTRSALVLKADGNLPACFEILRDTLHRDHDVVRLEEKKFVMFSETDSRSELQLLSTHVEEAVAKHNADHPGEPVRMTVRSRIRTGDEDAFAFLRSVVEDQDAGDPVRGVVSMISELDRLDEELKLAADIQLNMLESNFPPFPDRKEFDLFASMTPAKEVGGDFYDFFLVDEDHLALVIADVSGKGIPAALFMMVSKTLIKNQLMSGCDPAAALEHVNHQLFERNSSMMFVTVWLAVLEISTGRGLACNAGHENPGIRRAEGDFELLKYKHGIVVGVRKDAKFENRELELRPGDSVFVYTDGVPEAANAANELFGEQRLLESLNRDADAEPEALIRRMHDEVDAFAAGAPQFDDITMLCLKYYGEQKKEKVPKKNAS